MNNEWAGYWFRAAELTACHFGYTDEYGQKIATAVDSRCKEENARIWTVWLLSGPFEKINDGYLWNAMWAIFSCSTTVGFGDVLATTHTGRFVVAIGSVIGLFMAALLTSAFMFKLQYTPAEFSANLLMEKERANRDLGKFAAQYIRSWLEDRRLHRKLRDGMVPHQLVDLIFGGHQAYTTHQKHLMAQAFKNTKQISMQEFNEMLSDEVKVDMLAKRTKELCQAAESIQRSVAAVVHGQRTSSTNEPLNEFETIIRQKSNLLRKNTFIKGKTQRARQRITMLSELLGKDKSMEANLDVHSETSTIKVDKKTAASPGTDLSVVIETARTPTSRRWRRSRDKVEYYLKMQNFGAAICGVLGTLLSICQNEMVVRNISSDSILMNSFKFASSIVTIGCLYFVYRIYWTNILYQRLHIFLRRGTPLDDDVGPADVFKRPWFLLECLVCVLHCPPFVSFEWSNEAMGNIVVYRIETLMCSWTILRLYLCWRSLADRIIADIPSKHHIAGCTGVHFDSVFVLKTMLNSWNSIYWIAAFFISVVGIGGYVFRLAENTHSCKFENSTHPDCGQRSARYWTIFGREFEQKNDLYLLNSAWFIFTSVIPGGGGNMLAATHFGRCVAAGCVICGVLITSLTTASLGNLMLFTASEHTAMGVMNRERFRNHLKASAADIICIWWRKRRKPSALTRRQRKMQVYGFRYLLQHIPFSSRNERILN